MPAYFLAFVFYVACLSLSCNGDQAEINYQEKMKLPPTDLADAPKWNGIKLEYLDTSQPDYYLLSVRVKDPKDQKKYQLSFTPPLPVKMGPPGEYIQKHRIDMRKISVGHHTFEAFFKHQDGRVHRELISFHRQPVLLVDNQGKISCKPAKCSGQITWSGELTIKVEPNTKVVFDQNIVIAKDSIISFKLDILQLAMETPHLFSAVRDPSIPQRLLQKKLMLIFPDKTRTEHTFEWDHKRVLTAVTEVLKPLRNQENRQGIIFPGERRKKRNTANGLIILPSFKSHRVNRVTDIKWVAFIDERQRSQDCGSYRNLKTNNKRVVMIQYTDLEVKMFNRNTGQQISQRVFRAPRVPCPKRKSISLGVKSNVNYGDVFAWINQRIK